MRLLVLLVCVAVASATPLLGRKSINAKAIEAVDQNLGLPQAGHNVDRAKKDVTFCVEVRQDNTPVVVDCNNRQGVYSIVPGSGAGYGPGSGAGYGPGSAPAPAPAAETAPAPASETVPAPQLQPLNIEVPCEPEMAAYVVQPPQEVVYAPTGNCVPQIPSVIQVPTAPSTVPTQVLHLPTGPSSVPTQVFHLPTGHLHGHHGLNHGQNLKPLHTHVVPNIVPNSHHLHHLQKGVKCTCQETIVGAGRSADGATIPTITPSGAAAAPAAAPAAAAPAQITMSTEDLARKFLEDLAKNQANSPNNLAQPMMMMPGSAPSGQMQIQMPMQPRYVQVRPIMNTQPSAITITQPGTGMYPGSMGQPMSLSHLLRMKALEDSFTGNPAMIVPGTPTRICRDDGEEAAATAAAAAAAGPEAKAADNQEEVKKLSPSEIMEQMKKSDQDDSKSPRIARYIMDKDEAESRLEEN